MRTSSSVKKLTRPASPGANRRRRREQGRGRVENKAAEMRDIGWQLNHHYRSPEPLPIQPHKDAVNTGQFGLMTAGAGVFGPFTTAASMGIELEPEVLRLRVSGLLELHHHIVTIALGHPGFAH